MPGILTVTPRQTKGFAGDDWWISLTLYEDGVVAVLTGATITVGVRDETGTEAIAAQAQSSSSTGANWGVGLIIVSIPNIQTSPLYQGRYFLEIQTYLNSRYKTWPLVPIDVEQYSIYNH